MRRNALRRQALNPNDFFIRRIQNALLVECISTWRRRGKTLLEINCGDGRFLRHLWHNGFDVVATEADWTMRAHAAALMRNRAEVYAAHANHLPFDDGHFDWAVLHLGHETVEDIRDALQEAIRVAAHGMIVTFWNTSSPVLLLTEQKHTRLLGVSWWTVWNTLREVGEGTITTRSTLLFAFSFLRSLWPRLFFSNMRTRLPLGAWTILRLDMSPQSTVTPLALPLHLRKMPHLEPLLEP